VGASHVAVTSQTSEPASPLPTADETLAQATLAALDDVLHALVLEPLGHDRFRVVGEPNRFDRVFGGQTVAQALVAATATVTGKTPHSLHAYFVAAGTPGEPLLLTVDRVRDGRSTSTRRVTVLEGERPLLSALASFHDNPERPQLAGPPPAVAAPDDLPRLQDWARDVSPELRPHSRSWIEQPPPLELRMGEPPSFLGGPARDDVRSHWMRLPRGVGDDAGLHTALLAYASDYLLLDMALRSHPEPLPPGAYAAFSLDHAIWFHGSVRFDRWHLHSQRTRAISGHRGLVEGTIHDDEGRLVATAMQEVLVRPRR
jgi:acyl-CoA thioesterase II